MKLKSRPLNPVHNITFKPKYKELFQRKENAIKSFGLRMESIIEEANIPLKNIHNTIKPTISPWEIKQPKVELKLSNLNKSTTHL